MPYPVLRPALRHALILALAALATAGHAAPLGDPTRPPGLAAPSAAPAHRAHAAAPAASVAAPPAPVLQSVQLRAGSASALVDGRLVQVGERLGQFTVTAIDAHGLLLRNEQGRTERLNLLSGVSKLASGAAPAGASIQARSHAPAEPLVASAAASRPQAGKPTP